MSGYQLEAERQVTLTGPLCEEDTLDVEATPRHRTLCDSTGVKIYSEKCDLNSL